jgi:hypothetical protein
MACLSLSGDLVKSNTYIIRAASLSKLVSSTMKCFLKFLHVRYSVTGWPQYPLSNPYRNLKQSQFVVLLLIACRS